MSRNRSGRYGKIRPVVGDKGRQILEKIDENNRVLKMFSEFRNELDEKHDRYEKIVKQSRDITIENKRIIFLLHSTNTDIESKKEAVIGEATTRLQQVTETNFKNVATILKNLDQYQYHKAYTGGVQEFIEAYVFCQYLRNGTIPTWLDIFKLVQYEDDTNLVLPHIDYILGIADFTGELMRRCINNLGIGNITDCFKTCDLVKSLYTGFIGIMNAGSKEFGRKMYVLKQSLNKMELVCYNIQIRGSEVPKHMLGNVLEATENAAEDDEGYY